MSDQSYAEPPEEVILRAKLDEAREDIGSLQGRLDVMTDDALLMRELKAAVRGMNGLTLSYTGPKQNVGRGLVTDTELRIIDRILNRIEIEANQGI